MTEHGILVYGLLATFVLASLNRNQRQGRDHLPQLVAMGWMLFVVSIGGAAWMSLRALDVALSA